jgi:hypothetical protein
MSPGNTRASLGKAINIIALIMMAIKKGKIPLKIFSKGASGAFPLMIYTLTTAVGKGLAPSSVNDFSKKGKNVTGKVTVILICLALLVKKKN